MKNTNNREKNLEWMRNQPLSAQLNMFQEYTEIMKIVANTLTQESRFG